MSAAFFLFVVLAFGCDGETSCFEAGTQVQTPSGDVAIEKLRVGDTVYAFDETRQVRTAAKVTRTFVHEDKEVRTLRLANGETIGVTDEHPFYVPERGTYVRADRLEHDEALLFADASSEISRLNIAGWGTRRGVEKVFNIEVADHHNYFVQGVLVHNKTYFSPRDSMVDSAADAAADSAADARSEDAALESGAQDASADAPAQDGAADGASEDAAVDG